MAVSPEILDELESLSAPLTRVREAIDSTVVAHRDGSELTVNAAVSQVEEATEAWLQSSREVEERLLGYVEQPDDSAEQGGAEGDAADAVSRLSGVSFLHAAVACDLAVLVPLDQLQPAELVSAAHGEWPDRSSTIQNTAFGEGSVLAALGTAEDDAEPGSGTGMGTASDSYAVVEDVVTSLVKRAGNVTTSVLLHLAPGPHAIFSAVSPALEGALGLAPDAVQKAAEEVAKRVARLVRLVIRRLHEILEAVSSGFGGAVGSILAAFDPEEFVVKNLVVRLLGRVFKAPDITRLAFTSLAKCRTTLTDGRVQLHRSIEPKERDRRIRGLKKLARSNKRWVGPAGVVASGLDPLWAVGVTGVPAAPIVAFVLLAWSILITGDQLDADGWYPNFWKGVLQISKGL